MRRIICLAGIILCCLTAPSAGAGEVDSMLRELARTGSKNKQAELYAQIAFVFSGYDPDTALVIARKGMEVSVDPSAATGYASCMNSMGWAYYRLGKNDSAENYLQRAVSMFTKQKLPMEIAVSLSNLATVYETDKQYEKALRTLMQAKLLLEPASNANMRAYTDKQIGIVYRKQGYFDAAKQYLKTALAEFEVLNKNNYISDVLSSLGSVYLQTGQYDSTFWCYRRAIFHVGLDNISKGINNKHGMAYNYENLGIAFLEFKAKVGPGATDSALSYFKKAYQLFMEEKVWVDASFEKVRISECLMDLNKYDEAEALLTSALHTFDSLHFDNYLYEVCKLLSRCYKDKGNYKAALKYQEQASVLYDTLNAHDKNEIMADMLTKYESEKKDKTIALLDAQKKLTQKELSRNRVIILFSSLLAVLALSLIVTLFNRYRIKQQLKEVNLRNQLANDLHDDIGSSLSSIVMMSRMASSKALSRISDEDVIKKIGQNAQEVMDKISDIVWTTNPKFDDGSNLREKIESYLLQLRRTTTVNIRFSISEELDHLRFPMEARKNIFLVLKEVVNNALKYAQAEEVAVEIKVDGKIFSMAITDDGKGMNMDRQHWGNGLHSVHARAQAIGGKLRINSIQGRGTSVILDLPVPAAATRINKLT